MSWLISLLLSFLPNCTIHSTVMICTSRLEHLQLKKGAKTSRYATHVLGGHPKFGFLRGFVLFNPLKFWNQLFPLGACDGLFGGYKKNYDLRFLCKGNDDDMFGFWMSLDSHDKMNIQNWTITQKHLYTVFIILAMIVAHLRRFACVWFICMNPVQAGHRRNGRQILYGFHPTQLDFSWRLRQKMGRKKRQTQKRQWSPCRSWPSFDDFASSDRK